MSFTGMARSPLRIEVSVKDQKALKSLLAGGVPRTRLGG
jgi:hypothetical protein